MILQDPNNPTVKAFLKGERKRMGISEDSANVFDSNMYAFSNTTRHMESDDDRTLKNPESSAKGSYQFTDDSVATAKQRLRNRIKAGNTAITEDYINAIPDNPHEWTDEQEDIMFYGNMFSQTGSDDVLKKVAVGDMDAFIEAYSRFHHTNPDEATLKRIPIHFNEENAERRRTESVGVAGTVEEVQEPEVPPLVGQDYEDDVAMWEQAQQVSQLMGLGGDELQPDVEESRETLRDYNTRLDSLEGRRGLGIQDAQSDVQAAYKELLKEHRQTGVVDPSYKPTSSLSGRKWADRINYTPAHSINGVLEILEGFMGEGLYDRNGDLQINDEVIGNLVNELDASHPFFGEGGFIEGILGRKGLTVPQGMDKKTLFRALLYQDISYKLGTWAVESVDYGSAQSRENPLGVNNPEFIKWLEEEKGDSFMDIKNGLEIINGFQTGHVDSPLMAMDGSGFEPMTNAQKDDAHETLTGYHVFDGQGRLSEFRRYFSDPEELGKVEWVIEGAGKATVRALNMFGLAYEPVDMGDDPEIGAGWDMLGYMIPTIAAVATTKGLGGGALLTSSIAGVVDAAIQLVTPREENLFNFVSQLGETDFFLTDNYIPYLTPVLEGLDDIADSDLIEALTIRQGNDDAQNALIGLLEGAAMGVTAGAVLVGTLGIVAKTLVVLGKGAKKGAKLSASAVKKFSKKAKEKFGWDEHERMMFERAIMEGEGRLTNMYAGLDAGQLVSVITAWGKSMGKLLTKRGEGKLSSKVDFKEAVEGQELELEKILDSFDQGEFHKGDVKKIDRAIRQVDDALFKIRKVHGFKTPPELKPLVDALHSAFEKLQAGHQKATGKRVPSSGRESGTYREGREDLHNAADDWLRSKHRERELDIASGDSAEADEMLAKLKNDDGSAMTREEARIELKIQKGRSKNIHRTFLEVANDSEHNKYGGADGRSGKGLEEFHGTRDGYTMYDYLKENYDYEDVVGNTKEGDVEARGEVELTDEQYAELDARAEKKMRRMKKSRLIELAESQGIDSSGTKGDIVDRILAAMGEGRKPVEPVEPVVKVDEAPKPLKLDLDEMSLGELRDYVRDNNITLDGKRVSGRSAGDVLEKIRKAEGKKKKAKVKIDKKPTKPKRKTKKQLERERIDLEELKVVVARGAKELAEGNRVEVTPETPNVVVERVLKERLIDRNDAMLENGDIDYDYINAVEPDPVKRAVELKEEITIEIEDAKARAAKEGGSVEISPVAGRLQDTLDRLMDKMRKLGKIGLTIEDISDGKWMDGDMPKSIDEILSLGAKRGKKAYKELVGESDTASKAADVDEVKTEEPEVKTETEEPEVKTETEEPDVKTEEPSRRKKRKAAKVKDSASDHAESEQVYKEAELDDALENQSMAEGGEAVRQAIVKRTVQFIQDRAAYTKVKKGAPTVDKDKAAAKMLRSFVMLQRVLAKADFYKGVGTQKGFMARKVLPPMYKEGNQALIEWSKRSFKKGMLTPQRILALTNKYNVGYKKKGFKSTAYDIVDLHDVSDDGVAAMLQHFHTSRVLKTRRVHRPLDPTTIEGWIVGAPRMAQLLKDFGNSGLVSGIGTQFAAAQGLALKKPRYWMDSLMLNILARGGGDVSRMAREVIDLEKAIKKLQDSGDAPKSKAEILEMLRGEQHLDPETRSHNILRKLFVPSADNVYVVRGLEERGVVVDELRGSRDQPLNMNIFGNELEVPSSGLTSLGFAAAEIESEALRNFWLGAAALQEGMARVVMSGFIDKATKNFGGKLHTRELLKELVSTKMDNGFKFDEVETIDMLLALREWNTGRAGGTIGFDEAQDVWMKNRLGLWMSKKEVPDTPEGLSELATQRWNEWQSGTPVGTPKKAQYLRDKLDTMYTADQNARSRMEELTLQHETDFVAKAFGHLSQNPWTGLFAKFGKTSANTFTMGIESTPLIGEVWRRAVKDGGANTASNAFNGYAKQAAFVGAMATAAGIMRITGTSNKEKFSINERGEVVMRVSASMDKIKEECMDRFAGDDGLLVDMAAAHDAWNAKANITTNYADDTDAYLEEVLWAQLKPEKGESTMTYDRAGYIGNCGNMMVRIGWLCSGYSPRFTYQELENQGFMAGIEASLEKFGMWEHGTSFATDVYKDILDTATGDSPVESAVNLLLLNRTMLPASGLVTDVDRHLVGSRSTKVALESAGEGMTGELRKASVFSELSGDKLPSRVDFYSMPMEQDEYDPKTFFLGRKNYQSTWYEDIFEDIALEMRAPSPVVFDNVGENDDINFRDFTARIEGESNHLNAYEAFGSYMLTDRYRSQFSGRMVTSMEEAREYCYGEHSGDFKVRYNEVMSVRTWTDSEIEADRKLGADSVWDSAMKSRLEIRGKLNTMRSDRIQAFRSLVRTEKSKDLDSIAWTHNFVDSEGVSLYDRIIEKNGYREDRLHESAERGHRLDRGATELEALIR